MEKNTFSDHINIQVTIDVDIKYKKMEYHNVRRTNYKRVKDCISKEIGKVTNVEELLTLIKSTMDRYTIFKRLRTRGHPWITEEVMTAIRKKNDMYKKLRQTKFKDRLLADRYKETKNQVNATIKKAKREYNDKEVHRIRK